MNFRYLRYAPALILIGLFIGCLFIVPVTDVYLNTASATIIVGSTEQLTAAVFPVDATDLSIGWQSSNESVATVDANGLVSGVSPGDAEITVTTTNDAVSDICAVSVVPLNLSVASFYLTQAIQTVGQSVPLVSGRDAFLRVFVVSNVEAEVLPTVRVRLYQNGNLVDTITIDAPSDAVPTDIDESSLLASWNLNIPGATILPGLAILVDVDPDNQYLEDNESDNQFPVSGQASLLDIRQMSDFQGRLVPIQQSAFGTTGDVTDGNKSSYLSLFRTIFPVDFLDVDVRSTYTTAAVTVDQETDWSTVLSEILQLQTDDASSRYYYGVLQASAGTPWAGLGYVGNSAAIGWDSSSSRATTYAHELGHNFDRQHTPCGSPANIDPNYPFPSGNIGSWGWNSNTGQLVDSSTADLMGYCWPKWISEYTYKGVLDFRAAEVSASKHIKLSEPVLALWGRFGDDGVIIEPAYVVEEGSVREPKPGPQLLEGLDDAGNVLFSRFFQGKQISREGTNESHFSFTLAIPETNIDRLAGLRVQANGQSREIWSTAPTTVQRISALENTVRQLSPRRRGRREISLQWDKDLFPMAVIRDPKTGEILSFARGGDSTIVTSVNEVEIQLSDGVRSSSSRFTVR